MKKIILLLLISSPLFGQNIDYNKIILPENTRSEEFGEKLVQLAWKNNPANDVVKREVKIAEYDVKKSAADWLNIIHIQGNLNEFVLNPATDVGDRAAFWPKYNFGAEIRLGMFLTIPYTTKQNRQKLGIAESNVNIQKLEVRNTVLRAYNEYLLREKIFRLQSQLALDNETSHKLEEAKFKSGEITFEKYSLSLAAYSKTSIEQLQAETDYKNAKLDLEELIGVRLEDVR